jgi:hypothetical protein
MGRVWGAERGVFGRYNGWLLRVETEGTNTGSKAHLTSREKIPGGQE